ncbi:NAD-glutamate dehydrogenase [Knoellia subterranea]|uniref:NAD-glutamate dehydrogenase n=1 Tax=Knoellia subterranea KCTC 19937 TaxID=1385521 RepID=A0A0A0JIW5_9MICO|nr:NAD-glutamate dehydrogenase [Knoellia subterranea]KGN37003.1 NAD-glutamate dehydrogenase [Knoellia subterranea KCTC 19937]
MTESSVHPRSTTLDSIVRAFAELDDRPDGAVVVSRYFRHVPEEELSARPAQTLAGSVKSHLDLAQQRVPGTAAVRVFNPTTESDGWSSARSVIQIVTDDMPFLVDSVTSALVERDIDIHLVVHPQLRVRRDASGALLETCDEDCVAPADGADGVIAESWILLTIDRESDEAGREELQAILENVLVDVREAVADWPAMRTRCLVIAAELEGAPPVGVPAEEVSQAVAFLRWMADNHFTFLGYREYSLEETPDGDVIRPLPGSGLGMLQQDPPADKPLVPLSPESSRKAREQGVLVLTKANSRSTVHRPAYLDYVGVRTYSPDGQTLGEKRFLGLYASTAYTESVLRLPVVAEKVAAVVERSGLAADSHTGKDLIEVLETYPRDELIQASPDQLFETAMAVAQLQERRRTKLFLREDDFGRFVSCQVYIPRDRYNTGVRTRMAAILKDAFGGESVEFTARVSERALSRLQFVVRMPAGEHIRSLDEEQRADLERRLVEVSRNWADRLGDGLRDRLGEVEGDRLFDRFGRGFPTAYEETFAVVQGVADLHHLDRLGDDRRTSVALYRPTDSPENLRRFKLFRIDPLSLTDILPIFTDMGVEVVDEQPYEVTRTDGSELHVYDFGLRVNDPEVWSGVTHERLRDLFESAVLAVWDGSAESDGFNQLVLAARLTWRQVVILRTVAKYLRQTQATFSQSYFEDALVSNPGIATDLVAFFEARFDPDAFSGTAGPQRDAAQAEIAERITSALDDVSSLDEDRIIRAFLAVMQATLRTNFFQTVAAGAETDVDQDGVADSKPYVSLKLNPKAIPDLPAPRPAYEIWVYSPQVEGVHLRFGSVARGGLRWSDRREDFRTEILGLVKAQMVKNAVIVPTGSKGGFYAKQLPDPAVSREDWLAEGQSAYRTFISGLLDLTDNRVGTEIQPPTRVVRHDEDDPYLVVAADKGTATFSDIANGVAQSYGFWLDDAFASGGSAGYDHKAMGITARGAWESVKRHFREMGVDTQTEDFTVVGVGDMSGDVFGNGMLLSEHIRLVAAFDHRHVFVDPNPVAAQSFQERKRLFELPRSSWDDYDRSLISEGGGVFARSLKSIAVTPQMREALGLPEGVATMTPTELIHAIVLAPVDLFWNGGIGTYVKASSESHLEIGDRANDAIRVNGDELRVQVVGEGGNLGLSQLGRIEAALSGVRVNTDAIDNSAGVDTSDHEVNIKILLGDVVRRGDLTVEERNTLLASMTDDVAEHVLRDNYEQNVLLGNARAQEVSMAPVHQRLMGWLEERGELDRGLEFLPTDAEIEKRTSEGIGLKSPEFAVLVAYAKLALKKDILESALPDDPYFAGTLADYFPAALREAYAAELGDHPLRREIVTNSVVNSMVNRGGITFAFRAQEEAAGSPEQVARAFIVCREVFDLRGYVEEIEALDNVLPTSVQTQLYLEFRRLLDRAVRWLLAARPGQLDITTEVERFAPVVADLGPRIPELLQGGERERVTAQVATWEEAGVPAGLAQRAASLLDSYSLLDVVDIATDLDHTPLEVAEVYFRMSERFSIDTMLNRVAALPRDDRWDSLARGALRDDLYGVLEAFTRSAFEFEEDLDGDGTVTADERIESWSRANADAIERGSGQLTGIRALEKPNSAALSVGLRALRSMVRSGK